jgi:hypothetical protein
MNWLPPPGPARQRQVLLLVGLLVVLAILAWVEFGPARTSPAASNRQAPPAAGAAPLVVPAPLKLDALTAVPEPEAVGRNPFGYGPPPRVAAPPASQAPMVLPPQPTGPPVPQGPPPIPLTLTGLTDMPGAHGTMATLKEAGSGALFQAFEGDVVDGRYRVVKIGLQSVVVSYLDGSGSRTLPLGGQE